MLVLFDAFYIIHFYFIKGAVVQQQQTQPKRDSSRRSWSPRGSICTTPLAEETEADRFRFWEEAQSLTVDRWKAGHVLAWFEFGLGMSRYLSACAENIKSGKVSKLHFTVLYGSLIVSLIFLF